jgi:hypothetical protein
VALVTILGGTGVFGSRIARNLARFFRTPLRIVARNEQAGLQVAQDTGSEFRRADVENPASLSRAIEGSSIVIHAAGPFQTRDYSVARACIECGAHYLDLADARDFVTGIRALDALARKRGVFVCSGASSVPAVTHAMICAMQPEFASIDTIDIALSPGNQNPRGASTIGAILSYLGRPIRVWEGGRWTSQAGWGRAHRRLFPSPVGSRRVHTCDVPDLELFPAVFGAKSVHFFAGVEVDLINYTLSGIAAIRGALPFRRLERRAALFLKGSLLLYRMGSKNGSLAAWVSGQSHAGGPIERRIATVTENDGPATPCSPATVLAARILLHGPPHDGAVPCMGYVSLAELAEHLSQFGVRVVSGDGAGWK